MEHKFPLRRSNRENWTTFWAVPLFLGIFQSVEPKKRFPFSTRPEFSEFLIKWKAPIVTERGLLKFSIKNDEECLYCGQNDSIDHTFIECTFTRTFTSNVLQWLNSTNACRITPTTEEILFGVFSNSFEKKIMRNLTILYFLCVNTYIQIS